MCKRRCRLSHCSVSKERPWRLITSRTCFASRDAKATYFSLRNFFAAATRFLMLAVVSVSPRVLRPQSGFTHTFSCDTFACTRRNAGIAQSRYSLCQSLLRSGSFSRRAASSIWIMRMPFVSRSRTSSRYAKAYIAALLRHCKKKDPRRGLRQGQVFGVVITGCLR